MQTFRTPATCREAPASRNKFQLSLGGAGRRRVCARVCARVCGGWLLAAAASARGQSRRAERPSRCHHRRGEKVKDTRGRQFQVRSARLRQPGRVVPGRYSTARAPWTNAEPGNPKATENARKVLEWALRVLVPMCSKVSEGFRRAARTHVSGPAIVPKESVRTGLGERGEKREKYFSLARTKVSVAMLLLVFLMLLQCRTEGFRIFPCALSSKIHPPAPFAPLEK